jgi:hypothetical protein
MQKRHTSIGSGGFRRLKKFFFGTKSKYLFKINILLINNELNAYKLNPISNSKTEAGNLTFAVLETPE